jgi:hypothetical protein
MPVLGAAASLLIGDAANVLTQVAHTLESISNSNDTEKLTASSFNPGSTVVTKTVAYGATERAMTLNGWYDATIDAFWESISGLQGRNFEYYPEGNISGKRKTVGTMNIGIWNGPGDQNVNGFIPYTIEVAVITRVVSTV